MEEVLAHALIRRPEPIEWRENAEAAAAPPPPADDEGAGLLAH
jgi:ATP-dependent Lon protease